MKGVLVSRASDDISCEIDENSLGPRRSHVYADEIVSHAFPFLDQCGG
jgi:hypothetical protein